MTQVKDLCSNCKYAGECPISEAVDNDLWMQCNGVDKTEEDVKFFGNISRPIITPIVTTCGKYEKEVTSV